MIQLTCFHHRELERPLCRRSVRQVMAARWRLCPTLLEDLLDAAFRVRVVYVEVVQDDARDTVVGKEAEQYVLAAEILVMQCGGFLASPSEHLTNTFGKVVSLHTALPKTRTGSLSPDRSCVAAGVFIEFHGARHLRLRGKNDLAQV